MKPEERCEAYLKMLGNGDLYTLKSIAEAVGVSVTTVRRDLEKLEADGVIYRTERGVTKADAVAAPLLVRDNASDAVKRALCARFAKCLRPHDTVFIDHTRTLLLMVPFLKTNMYLTVFTNGLPLLHKLAEKGIDTYLVGGMYSYVSESFLGPVTEENIRTYHFKKAVLSPHGIVPDEGLFTGSEDHYGFRRAVIDCADEVYVIGTATKIGRRGKFKICDASEVTEFVIA